MALLVVLGSVSCGRDTTPRAPPEQPAAVASDQPASDQPVLPPEHARLVGAFHPPYPPGYAEVGGWVLRDTLFGITHLAQGPSQVFLMDSLVGRNAAGQALWVTVSAVAFPPFDTTLESAATLACAVDGLRDIGVVALGRWFDNAMHARDLANIRFAAKADLARRRWRILEPGRVACWVEYP